MDTIYRGIGGRSRAVRAMRLTGGVDASSDLYRKVLSP
jgi:hypothetical protein